MINILDILLALIIIFFTIRVMRRGFIEELLTVGALVGSLIIAALFSGIAAQLITRFFEISRWNQIIAFLILFIASYVVLKIFKQIMQNIISAIHLETLDSALGFLLGIAEGVAIAVFLILIIQIQPFLSAEDLLQKSIIATLLAPLIPITVQLFGLQFA